MIPVRKQESRYKMHLLSEMEPTPGLEPGAY